MLTESGQRGGCEGEEEDGEKLHGGLLIGRVGWTRAKVLLGLI